MSTLQARLEQLFGSPVTCESCPRWPPDLFACCATLLHESGAYSRVVALAEPRAISASWAAEARALGENWHQSISEFVKVSWPSKDTELPDPPSAVRALWSELMTHLPPTAGLNQSGDLESVVRLVKLLGVSDEACKGVGVRSGMATEDGLLSVALHRLSASSWRSLAWRVSVEHAAVLPKQHTPQRGLTIRSFSHHLALLPSNGVSARWYRPHAATDSVRRKLDLLNILVLPWPELIARSAFELVSPSADTPAGLAGRFRYFRYNGNGIPGIDDLLDRAITQARADSGDVDLVVLPELALSRVQLDRVMRVCNSHRCALITGVQSEGAESGPANYATFDASSWLADDADEEGTTPSPTLQRKHHRWCLDAPQVLQYGLEGRIPTSCDCWEWAELGEREIGFHTIERWLTLTTLICEDLARQDPVAQVVRAVGPNLVVALLMDGPQLGNRWSARYATVLAEDPGTSVLTVTSLGMSALTRERALKMGWSDRSRAIALWRDIRSGETVIELPEGTNAAILHVVCAHEEEFTADGRGDGGVAFFPVLTGWKALSVPSASSTRAAR